jgi:tetratricopeptide (TPR) repeat protein/predicted O-methyltransferase YrrM
MLMDSIEDRYYSYCMSNHKPYFGKVMWALQGLPIRHAYMQRLVEAQCRDRGERPFHILEIGSWAGGSAITWAEAIKKFNKRKGQVVCIDPWKLYFDPTKCSDLPRDQQAVYQEMAEALSSRKIFDLFLHNIRVSKLEDIILPFKGSSDDILPLFADGRFDLVFVDGDHSYPSVLKDLRGAGRIVCEGGLLCGDDLELQLSQLDVEHVQLHKERDYIADPKTKERFHPGVSLAVGEYFGEVSVWEGFWAMRKQRGAWHQVGLPRLPPDQVELPKHLTCQSPPELVKENYRGYNIVHYLDRYYALAQALGPVDLTKMTEKSLMEIQAAGLCVVGKSLEETECRIDQRVVPEEHPDKHLSKGVTLMREGRFGQAVPALLRAIEMKPHDPAIRNSLGIALYKLGNHADAEQSFRAALREAPDNVDAWVSLSNICCEQGRYTEAVEYLKEAASLDPRDAEVITALGTLGLNLKDEEAIRTSLQCFMVTEPNHPLTRELREALGESPVAMGGAV